MLDVRYEDVTKIWNRNPPPPYKPGGRGAMCPSWLPYSTDSYLHILVFVFVSCVSQFAKFCKLWARQRRQVFCVSQFVKFCKLWTRLRQSQHVFPFWSIISHFTFPTRITRITRITMYQIKQITSETQLQFPH